MNHHILMFCLHTWTGFGQHKAKFVEPVASAGEQSKGNSLQCTGIKLQPNGVGSVTAYSQGEAVSIGNHASLAEAGFAYESAAGHPPFPIAGTDASSGPVTNLDPSRCVWFFYLYCLFFYSSLMSDFLLYLVLDLGSTQLV
jgi:hypothetical protein